MDSRKRSLTPPSAISSSIHRDSSKSPHRHHRSSHSHHSHHHHHRRSRSRSGPRSSRHGEASSSLSSAVLAEEERDRYAGEYVSICLKNLDDTVSTERLYERICDEFRDFSYSSVRIVNNKKAVPHGYAPDTADDRIAFVNFTNHLDAKLAKRAKMNMKLCGGFKV